MRDVPYTGSKKLSDRFAIRCCSVGKNDILLLDWTPLEVTERPPTPLKKKGGSQEFRELDGEADGGQGCEDLSVRVKGGPAKEVFALYDNASWFGWV